MAVAAVMLLAIDPQNLGGIRLRGPADPAREKLLAIYKTLLPEGAPVRKLPPTIADARLLGGLDLTATLSAGRPVLERGLLAEADGGALVVPGAERMEAGLAGRIALAIDLGAVALERDGFAGRAPARFAVLACDEGLADEEPPPAALIERLGLVVALRGATRHDLAAPAPDPAAVEAARARLAQVRIDDASVEALAEAALRLGVFGLRPLLFACAAARASAALAGRVAANETDLGLAARLVLGPRATKMPAPPEEDAAEPESRPDEGDAPSDGSPNQDDGDGDPKEMAERVLEAAAAALPADLLALAGGAQAPRTASRAPGRAGLARASKRRGRPIGARPGSPENGARLDLVETLRAAAPWQRIRRRALAFSDPSLEEGRVDGEAGRGGSAQDAASPSPKAPPDASRSARSAILPAAARRDQTSATSPSPLAAEGRGEGASGTSCTYEDGPDAPSSGRSAATFSRRGRREDATPSTGPRILVRREDFRIQRLKERRRTLTIFAVDASGSAALHRLAEAKGAVELLLAQAYVRRDEVALVAFRGKSAELLLPPTRSLARAKRSLAGLPGGGGTPLASGLDAAAALCELARRRGDTPTIVLLTDGAANVARDGSGGRARAQEEALASAKALRALGFASVLIDVSPRPQLRAKELAEAMAARYVPLPSGDAAAMARAAAI